MGDRVSRRGRAPTNAPPAPEPATSPPEPPTREKFIHLDATQMHRLTQAIMIVEAAFGEKVYLVGSVMKTAKYRDVDLRIILEDDQFRALFGGDPEHHTPGKMMPFWCLVCNAVSEMLAARTGLPIDFQVQARSWVTDDDWDKVRNPINMLAAEAPPWHSK